MLSLIHVLVVAEHLNFRHAANVLGTTQSSVSGRIKALEQALGILLFERRHRGVRLTEAGRCFVAEVSTGIGHLDHAIRTAGSISSAATGQFAIGLMSSIAGGFLADLRARFRTNFPDIEHIVMEGPSAQIIAKVRDGKLDVALVLDPVDALDCHSRVLWTEPYLIALPSSHPLALIDTIAWVDLALDSFLLQTGGAGQQLFEHIVRRMAERGMSPRVRRCDVGQDTLMHMVGSEEGITLVSEAAQNMNCRGVVLRPIADETGYAQFSAIWSPHNRSPALLNLLDLATDIGKSGRSA